MRLFSWPVAEIEKLYNQSCVISELPLLRRKAIASVPGGLADVAVVLRVLEAKTIELNVRGMPVRIDVAAGRISCADKSAPLAVRNGRVNLRILVDRTSLEIFANDGEVAMLVAGAFTGDKIEMTSDASAQADEFTLHELKSSWNAGN